MSSNPALNYSSNHFCSFWTISILPAQSTVTPSKPSTRSHSGCRKNLFTKRLLYRGVFKMVCGNKASWNFHCNFLFDVLLPPFPHRTPISAPYPIDLIENCTKAAAAEIYVHSKFFPARKPFHSSACKYFMHGTTYLSGLRPLLLSHAPFSR